MDKAAGDQTSVDAGFEESDLMVSPFLPSILSLPLHPEKKMMMITKMEKRGGVNEWAVKRWERFQLKETI